MALAVAWVSMWLMLTCQWTMPRSVAIRRHSPVRTIFGWPLVIGGTLKAVYDLVLLLQFRGVATREDGVR